jgi:L-arabinose isomerase
MNQNSGGTNAGKARVGVFGIGLAAYWPQFAGLKERLTGHQQHVEERLGRWAEVVTAGLVDTPEAGFAAGQQFKAAGVDMLVCFVGTYATSSQVLPVVWPVGVPVLILNLQPVATLDYEHVDTGEWLAACCSCPVPELAGVFQRSGIEFAVVTGTLFDDEAAWEEIASWCRAAGAVASLRRARFGVLGHTYPGMLDMSAEPVTVGSQIGAHVEILEIGDLQERVAAATGGEVAAMVDRTRERFTLGGEVSDAALDVGARVAVGLERLATDFALGGLAYYYRGGPGTEVERIAANMILGNTLLTARGVPAAGEGDLKTAIAMKLMHELDAGGSFSEFMLMDFPGAFFLMGHDGPAHPGIGEGKPTLKELAVFHGKSGGGLAVEVRARSGPITVVGLTQTADGRLKLIGAEGESLPGPVLRIGNSSHRLRFALPPAPFIDAWCALGPTHHVALGLGHRLADVEKAARLLGLPFAAVWPADRA